MFRQFLFTFTLLVFVFAVAGCGIDDEPITSLQTAALVSPQNADGVTYLFASNRFRDTVYRIDTESLEVKEIKVGNKPRTITASPDGTMIAVANEDSMSVSVIDVSSLRVRSTVTGYVPRALRFSPDGQWLAVANKENQTVSLIRPAESMAQWRIWVGGGPADVDFDETSSYLAVACYNEDSVRIIDLATRKVVYDWSDHEHFDRPQAVIFGKADSASQNLLFVGNRSNPYDYDYESYADSIAVIHLPDNWSDDVYFEPEVEIIRSAPGPRGFLWNHAGNKLLAINHNEWYDSGEYQLDTVSMLDVVRGQVEEEYRFVVEENPVAAALAPGRELFAVACKDGDAVTSVNIDPSSPGYLMFQTVKTEKNPYALAFSPGGTQIVVVHETPLMPVSVVDLESGTSRIVYKSVSMDRWIE